MDICGLEATELSKKIHSRELSCVAVMKAFLDRITRFNGSVNAIVALAPREDLLAQAKALDDQERIPEDKPLWGIPFAVKDLYDAKGFVTSQGHLGYANAVAKGDEDFVKSIKRAGAIVIGKTNTPEFGTGSHTFNPVYGVTRNPHDLSKSAGGSSGGAAAALASSFVVLADGSDYAGSLRNPAAFCGVVGFRPTVNDPKAQPKKSGDWNQACIGPMARNVMDVALLHDVMTNSKKGAAVAAVQDGSIAWSRGKDRVAFLGNSGGRFPVETAILSQLQAAIAIVQNVVGDGVLVEEAFPDCLKEAYSTFLVLRYSDYFSAHGHHNPLQVKGAIRWNIEQGKELVPGQVTDALARRAQIRTEMDKWMGMYRFVCLPSTQVLPFDLSTEWPESIEGVPLNGRYLDWMQVCCEITLLGLPAISIPIGTDPKTQLPVGMQIVGRRGCDNELLRFAHSIEKALGKVIRFPQDIGAAGDTNLRPSKRGKGKK